MKLINIKEKYCGLWKDIYRLILNWLPNSGFISESTMEIKSVANGKFLMMKYDWHHEEIVQEGFIFLGITISFWKLQHLG